MSPSSHRSVEPAARVRALAGPVVVGFDGGPSSVDALVLARQLSELTHEALVVAVVQPLDMYVVPDPVLVADLTAAQYEEVDDLMARAGEILGVEERQAWRRASVAARSPALGLHRILDEREAGIVVLGRTHRHGVTRAVPGTTAGRLLHGAPCPVAIAPPGWASRTGTLSRISAGVDGSAESLIALRVAADLAARAGTTVEAVRVYQQPNPADPAYAFIARGYTEAMSDLRSATEHRLREALRAFPDDRVEPVVLEGRPAEQLARHSAGRDVLVVGSRGYGPLRSVVVGDVATALANEAQGALVVVPRGAVRVP